MKHKKVSFEDLYPLILDTVDAGNEFSFIAFGQSMLPTIRNGLDLVTLGPVKDNLCKNDIIFYRRNSGQFVLHRIVRVGEDSFDLCGDNQYCIEKGIHREQIIAKLVRLERNGETLSPAALSSRLFCALLPLRRFWIHGKSFLKSRLLKSTESELS